MPELLLSAFLCFAGLTAGWPGRNNRSVYLTVVLALLLGYFPYGLRAFLDIDGTAIVMNEDDLRVALQGPFNIIQIQSSFKLTDVYWRALAPFNVNRTVTIQARQTDRMVVDASDLKQRYILCQDIDCHVTIRGPMTVINPPGPGIDFSTPIPTFMGGVTNGTVTIQDVDVVSLTPTGLWYASNLVYLETHKWWVGDLKVKCESPVAFTIDWMSDNEPRRQFLDFPVEAPLMGYYRLDRVRMLLAKSYVCSNYTQSLCDNALQICGNTVVSSRGLPDDTCSPKGLAAACTTAELDGVLVTTPSPSAISTSQGAPAQQQSTSQARPHWWIGLVVGVVVFTCFVVAAVLLVHRYRRSHAAQVGKKSRAGKDGANTGILCTAAAEGGGGGHTAAGAGCGSNMVSRVARESASNCSNSSGDTPDDDTRGAIMARQDGRKLLQHPEQNLHTHMPQGNAMGSTGSPRDVTDAHRDRPGSRSVADLEESAPRSAHGCGAALDSVSSAFGISEPAPGSDDDSVIEYPAGRELLKQAALHQSTCSDTTLTLTFTNTKLGDTFSTLPTTSSSTDSRPVVIDMAPLSGPDGLPKLSRNPLGVTLLAVLGTGATGTVYQGLWQGCPVAVKVLRQAVDSQPDLDALLQFREATLGSELQHPRIVRTLAHALVVPEGIMDHGTGTIIRPGTVEAHIVSALCDMGTLRQWLQTTSRLRTPSALYNAVLLQQAPPSGSQAPSRAATLRPLNSSLDGSCLSFADANSAPQSAPISCTLGDERKHAQHARKASDLYQGDKDMQDAPPSCTPANPHDLEVARLVREAAQRLRSHVVAAALAPPLPAQGAAGNTSAGSAAFHGTPHSDAANLAHGLQSSQGQGQSESQGAPDVPSDDSMSYRPSHGFHPSKLYPPLAFMPPWHNTGVRVHTKFQAHLLASVDIMLEIVDGLGYLLSKGVVHGDLKPQNVLLCSQANSLRGFTVKICDFGIARVLTGSKSHTTVTHAPGTLCYFAPELLSTCRLSPASDVYSLGIIMYEVLTCKQPLAKLSMAQVLYKKATGAIDEYLTFPEGSPPEYVHLARSCYSLQPTARPTLNTVFEGLMRIRKTVSALLTPNTNPSVIMPVIATTAGTPATKAAVTVSSTRTMAAPCMQAQSNAPGPESSTASAQVPSSSSLQASQPTAVAAAAAVQGCVEQGVVALSCAVSQQSGMGLNGSTTTNTSTSVTGHPGDSDKLATVYVTIE